MVVASALPPGPAHLIGVGGYGMRGLARLLAGEGRYVSGTDTADGAALAELRREGIACFGRHGADCLPADTAVVIHSAAIPPESPELRAAEERGLPRYKYAEALGRFCRGRRVVACAGTHGKSTTTALLAWLLRRAAIDAGHLVGADPAAGMPELATNARCGDPMVIEACEYDRSFLQYRPHAAIITNIEKEHVDCFPTERELFDTFRAFVEKIEPGGLLVTSADLLDRIAPRERSDLRLVTFGRNGTWRTETAFHVSGAKKTIVAGPNGVRLTARCVLPGEHNVANLAAALALASELYGADRFHAVGRELDCYRGLRRRFDVIWRGGTVLIDDYAHHPTEIEATICAARERFPEAGRTIAVFQPHQRKRLEVLAAGFVRSLRMADRVLVTPVFAAREDGHENAASSASFVKRLVHSGADASFCVDFDTARRELLDLLEPRDVVLFMGAGDITDFALHVSRAVALRESTNGTHE